MLKLPSQLRRRGSLSAFPKNHGRWPSKKHLGNQLMVAGCWLLVDPFNWYMNCWASSGFCTFMACDIHGMCQGFSNKISYLQRNPLELLANHHAMLRSPRSWEIWGWVVASLHHSLKSSLEKVSKSDCFVKVL